MSESVPPRPDDTLIATGGERDVAPGSLGSNDDGARPNPIMGSHGPDGPVDRSNISLRHTTMCATWNVRGLTLGKLEVISTEMERCGVKVLGIAEHWWLSEGRFTTETGNSVFFAGKDSGRRSSGVGFIVEKEKAKAVLGYNPISDRIITLRLQAHPMNITFVQVYAPTTEANDEEMDAFYGLVQEALDRIPKKDIVILMGDWNAKIGKSTHKTEHVGILDFGRETDEVCA